MTARSQSILKISAYSSAGFHPELAMMCLTNVKNGFNREVQIAIHYVLSIAVREKGLQVGLTSNPSQFLQIAFQ
jgi:hypothetical protein